MRICPFKPIKTISYSHTETESEQTGDVVFLKDVATERTTGFEPCSGKECMAYNSGLCGLCKTKETRGDFDE